MKAPGTEANHWSFSVKVAPSRLQELPTYELNTTAVEERFDVIYKSYFGQKLTEAQEAGNPGPAVIFIANFDKVREELIFDIGGKSLPESEGRSG